MNFTLVLWVVSALAIFVGVPIFRSEHRNRKRAEDLNLLYGFIFGERQVQGVVDRILSNHARNTQFWSFAVGRFDHWGLEALNQKETRSIPTADRENSVKVREHLEYNFKLSQQNFLEFYDWLNEYREDLRIKLHNRSFKAYL